MADPLLEVRELRTRFFMEDGTVNAVESIDFTVQEGEVFGIVGESGSGKSVTALSLVDLIESPGRITAGEIRYRNADLAAAVADDHPEAVDGDFVDLRQVPERIRRSLRGPSFGMIFQDPMSSLNPSLTVGEQIAEAVEVQRRASANPRSTRARTQGYGVGSMLAGMVFDSREFVRPDSYDRAIELLDQVGIPDPEKRAHEFPHQFSGGMLQRAMIAQALAGKPDVLIADEPTTALDVTIQAQILDRLSQLQAEHGMTTVLITHNLGVIARLADRVGVMYAGEFVERGTLTDVFEAPVHPYTQGLLGSSPDLAGERDRLDPIPGNVPDLVDSEMPDRCYFADRCPKAMAECLSKPPDFAVDGHADENLPGRPDDGDDHIAKCYLADHEYDPDEALPEGYFDE